MDRNCAENAEWALPCVALRKESVDRNVQVRVQGRNWLDVALRKESVDRNITSRQFPTAKPRRSPQGERG